MENNERLESLHSVYSDISQKLSSELLKSLPDVSTLRECRRQLSQLDKDIRRIQMRKDWNSYK